MPLPTGFPRSPLQTPPLLRSLFPSSLVTGSSGEGSHYLSEEDESERWLRHLERGRGKHRREKEGEREGACGWG